MDIDSYDAEDAVEVLEGVHLAQLVTGDRASFQYFCIEPRAIVDTHSHEHEQLGFMNRGELVFTIDGEEQFVGPNESSVIPADEPRAAENRSDDVSSGIEVFVPSPETPPWVEGEET
ncbi:cupin domain-containing protein [Haladaptatus salinisoli]|uniref:cupin domain-containing protein n=1 Tax=Haladaptatus salinisoli TaxID=2884876 RepID=UPI001D0B3EEB|nr:cupin domain-containing protein [Haladaptatus salinisoli]